MQKILRKMSEKSKQFLKKAEDFKFGKINVDKNLHIGLILLIAVIFIAFVFRKLIEEWVESILLFVLLFTLTLLITKNILYSAIIGFILYFIFKSLMNSFRKVEKFANSSKNNQKKEDDEEDENNEKFNNNKNKIKNELKKKKSEKFENGKLEKTNLNIEESPITKNEVMDLDQAAKAMEKFGDLLNGGIKLNDDDKNETGPLDIDFKSSKYNKEGKSALQQAQIETYQLMDTVKNLEDTIKSLSPVLTEGKKVMDMFNTFKLN